MKEKQLIYRTFCREIETLEMGKPSTESFVFPILNGEMVRRRRISTGFAYFDTWQEAKDHLVEEARKEIVTAKLRLARANKSPAKVLEIEKENDVADLKIVGSEDDGVQLTKYQDTIIEQLESLIALTKEGRIICFAGVGMSQDRREYYTMYSGGIGTSVTMIGALTSLSIDLNTRTSSEVADEEE